jgi:hypothetical protein
VVPQLFHFLKRFVLLGQCEPLRMSASGWYLLSSSFCSILVIAELVCRTKMLFHSIKHTDRCKQLRFN